MAEREPGDPAAVLNLFGNGFLLIRFRTGLPVTRAPTAGRRGCSIDDLARGAPVQPLMAAIRA